MESLRSSLQRRKMEKEEEDGTTEPAVRTKPWRSLGRNQSMQYLWGFPLISDFVGTCTDFVLLAITHMSLFHPVGICSIHRCFKDHTQVFQRAVDPVGLAGELEKIPWCFGVFRLGQGKSMSRFRTFSFCPRSFRFGLPPGTPLRCCEPGCPEAVGTSQNVSERRNYVSRRSDVPCGACGGLSETRQPHRHTESSWHGQLGGPTCTSSLSRTAERFQTIRLRLRFRFLWEAQLVSLSHPRVLKFAIR